MIRIRVWWIGRTIDEGWSRSHRRLSTPSAHQASALPCGMAWRSFFFTARRRLAIGSTSCSASPSDTKAERCKRRTACRHPTISARPAKRSSNRVRRGAGTGSTCASARRTARGSVPRLQIAFPSPRRPDPVVNSLAVIKRRGHFGQRAFFSPQNGESWSHRRAPALNYDPELKARELLFHAWRHPRVGVHSPLTVIFLGLTVSAFGRWTVRTPFLSSAEIFCQSICSLIVKAR
jgi:hypothetical protein